MAINQKGLVFYKLAAQYSGDVTKNCGLSGLEVDGNFNFLRGMDISSIGVDPDTGNVQLVRYNGEIMKLDQNTGSKYEFSYDPEKGCLTITYPEGESVVLSGFSEAEAKSCTNGTIEGNGTKTAPLAINPAYMTGTYRPVLGMVNVAEDGEEFPKNPAVGTRIVSKEPINKAGLFYTFDEAKELDRKLKEHSSSWRVPTKEDWDKMLNALECPEDRNHDTTPCNEWAGRVAGKVLKSGENPDTGIDYWQPSEEDQQELEYSRGYAGFNILPVGAIWDIGFREGLDAVGYSSAFWSSSSEAEDDPRDIMAKHFKFNQNGVYQMNCGPDYRLSLRLVKDYDGKNFDSHEKIEGHMTPCVLMSESKTVWTAVNIGFNEFGGVGNPGDIYYEELTKPIEEGGLGHLDNEIHHFINEWDGKKWTKIEMSEGESVVIKDHKGLKFQEWRLVNGELVPDAELVKDSFKKDIEDLREDMVRGDEETVKDLTEKYTEADRVLRGDIMTHINVLAESVIAGDKEIREELKNSVLSLNNKIDGDVYESEQRVTDAFRKADQFIVENVEKGQDALAGAIIDGDNVVRQEMSNMKAILENSDAELKKSLEKKIEDLGAGSDEFTRKVAMSTGLSQDGTYIPAEVSNHISGPDVVTVMGAVKALDKAVGGEVDSPEKKTVYGTINKEIKDRSTAVNALKTELSSAITQGDETVMRAAEEALNTRAAELDSRITEATVKSTDGSVVVTPGAGTGLSVNIDNKTILPNADGKLSVKEDAFTKYEGINSISVSEPVNNLKKIGLKINPNDHVVSDDAGGLIANINLTYLQDSVNGPVIRLSGKNDFVISDVPVSDFLKDKFVRHAEVKTDPVTGKQKMYLYLDLSGEEGSVISFDVDELVKIYEAGDGLSSVANVFSAKISQSIKNEGYLRIIDDDKGLGIVGLNAKFEGYEGRIKALEDKIDAMQLEINALKETAITSVLGTDKEIKVSKGGNKNTVTIGFADDTIFAAGN